MTKKTSQIEDLKNAVLRLQEALNEQKTDFLRDASIQRFEFTFELAWKTIKTILEENAIHPLGTKSVIREAGRIGLISDVEAWFKFLEARNLTSHAYDLEVAENVYTSAQKFLPFVQELVNTVTLKHSID